MADQLRPWYDEETAPEGEGAPLFSLPFTLRAMGQGSTDPYGTNVGGDINLQFPLLNGMISGGVSGNVYKNDYDTGGALTGGNLQYDTEDYSLGGQYFNNGEYPGQGFMGRGTIRYADGGEVVDPLNADPRLAAWKRQQEQSTLPKINSESIDNYLRNSPLFGYHNPVREVKNFFGPAFDTDSDRPMRYRVLDTIGAGLNFPVRAVTRGDYSTVDVLQGLTGRDFPAVRESEARFYENNPELLKAAQGLGEALPLGLEGFTYAPTLRFSQLPEVVAAKNATKDAIRRFIEDQSGSVQLGKTTEPELPSLRKINQTPFYGEDVGPKGRISDPVKERTRLSLYSGLAESPKGGFFNPATSALLQEGVQPKQTVTYFKKQLGSRGGKLPPGQWEEITKGLAPDAVIDRDWLVQQIDRRTPELKTKTYREQENPSNFENAAQYASYATQIPSSNYMERVIGYGDNVPEYKDTHFNHPNIEGWYRSQDIGPGRILEEVQPQRQEKFRTLGSKLPDTEIKKLETQMNEKQSKLEKLNNEIKKEEMEKRPISQTQAALFGEKHNNSNPNLIQENDIIDELKASGAKLKDGSYVFDDGSEIKFGTSGRWWVDDPKVQQNIRERFSSETDKKALEHRNLFNEWRDLRSKYEAASEGIASSPYSHDVNEATDFLVKRALLDASNENKSWVGWTPGEAQADRYNLSNLIDRIAYDKENERLMAFDKNNNMVIDEEVPYNTKDFEKHIGQDPAKKLDQAIKSHEWEKSQYTPYLDEETNKWFISDPNGDTVYNYNGNPKKFKDEESAQDYIEQMIKEDLEKTGSGYPEISGLDLRVGGEGMNKFYGSGEYGEGGILPERLKSIVKRVTGEKPVVQRQDIGEIDPQYYKQRWSQKSSYKGKTYNTNEELGEALGLNKHERSFVGHILDDYKDYGVIFREPLTKEEIELSKTLPRGRAELALDEAIKSGDLKPYSDVFPKIALPEKFKEKAQKIGLPIYSHGGTVHDTDELPRLRPLN